MSVFLIAFRNLFGEKGRLAITVGGVAFSVILILVLLGLYQGWERQMTKFLGAIPADLWVGQKGSKDLSHSLSIVPRTVKSDLEKIVDVRRVTPFIGRQVSFEVGGKEEHLYIVGVDKNHIILPYKIVEGAEQPAKGEIIIDQSFAHQKGYKLGDEIKINDKSLKIAGISSGGNLLVYSFALADINDVREILKFDQFDNYYLVGASQPDNVKSAIAEKYPDLSVVTQATFLDNNTALLRETFLPIIGVLVAIAIAIGVSVIGLTIFTATIEKSREYGVLKAIGYTNGQLFAIALIQSLIAGVVGFGVGLLLVPAIVKLATAATSSFIYEIDNQSILIIFAIAILMSVLASFIPLKRLVSIDPAQVFKA